MIVLNLEKSIKTNLLLLSFLLISLFPFFISPKYNVSSVKSNSDESTASPYLNFDMIRKDDSNINDWDTMIMKFDQNNNGISDQFEEKLWSNKKSINIKNLLNMREGIEVIFNKNEKNIEPIVCNQVNVIIQFPDDYDYITAISLFKDNGGIIKSTYKEIINGFAGDLNYERFILFYEKLKQNNIPFLIEENGIVKSNLYIASRNMRLRPYTWGDLGYTGDNDSSIAILDTGIDDNHEFFDNFTDGDFRYKIVGWNDTTALGASTPIDDNGHGSHCAGIAAGMGTPLISGRSVATSIPNLDFTGWSFYDGLSGYVIVTNFNVTNPGVIEIECNFTDETPGDDYTNGIAYLYRGGTAVNSTGSLISTNWEKNLTYTVSPSTLGKYTLRIYLYFNDNDTDGNPYVWDPVSNFRGEIHWPFNPPSFGMGNPWRGIAPQTHLVGVKVLNQNGIGDINDILDAYQWIFNNRMTYNITVMSMSYGGESNAAEITAVNNLVEKGGIVAVAAAGNDDVGENKIGSPADADNAITVAAMNYKDQITSYSSQGGRSVISNTTKPDITAPGGSFYDFPMYSADSDDVGEGLYPDDYNNDLNDAQGTSMATPAVAGAASLLITAMGGGNKWNWDNGTKAKLVKSLLLMTATETYPLRRESYGSYSPSLNRVDKDVHEGYGRINVDAAIEAWTINLTNQIISSQPISVWLNTSQHNPSGKHAYAGYVNLVKDQWYIFNLTVPSGVDYDLHLYNYTPSAWGEPVRVVSSISPQKGSDEIINYTASHTGKFFLVVKAIGKAIPIAEEDDDKETSEDEMTILEFLLSPLGLLIIGTVFAAVIIIVILARRSARKRDEKESERIKALMERSYY